MAGFCPTRTYRNPTVSAPARGNVKFSIGLGSDDPDSGSEIPYGPVIAADGTIYVTTSGGSLFAVSPTGKVKWRFFRTARSFDTVGGAVGAPAIGADGTIYVISRQTVDWHGRVHAISTEGEELWHADLPGSGPGLYDAKIVIDGKGTLYLSSMGDRGGVGRVLALSSKGALWELTAEDMKGFSDVSIGPDGTLYAVGLDASNEAIKPGAYKSSLFAIAPTGTIRWRTKIDSFGNVMVKNGSVLADTTSDLAIATDTSGNPLWQTRAYHDAVTSLGQSGLATGIGTDHAVKLADDGTQVASSSECGVTHLAAADGAIVCVSMATGGASFQLVTLNADLGVRWKATLPGVPHARAALGRGMVVIPAGTSLVAIGD